MENSNLWGSITAEDFAPLLEFDFLGADAWEACGLTEAEAAAKKEGDRLELRTRQAARLELARSRQWFCYARDTSGYAPPPWATRAALHAPLGEKAPWAAAWDRLLRMLMRTDAAAGHAAVQAALEDLFIKCAAASCCGRRLLACLLAARGGPAAGGARPRAAGRKVNAETPIAPHPPKPHPARAATSTARRARWRHPPSRRCCGSTATAGPRWVSWRSRRAMWPPPPPPAPARCPRCRRA